jgi:hypothetical protein
VNELLKALKKRGAMAKEQLVTSDTAKLAVQAGFVDTDSLVNWPTQTQLQKWLRDEKKQCFTVMPWEREIMKYAWRRWTHFPITDHYYETSTWLSDAFDTWEAAMEDGLQYCLKALLEIK